MFELQGVSKRFGTTHAVGPIDLACAPDRTCVLIGPSGCGKSTLLRMMVGLVEPDAGEVRFDGEQLGPANVRSVRRRLGYVIQEGGLFPHLTARENLGLLARYLGREEERVEARVRELCELTRFPVEGLDRYPVQLSGGQRQRVGLMRALMLDPDALLLDEPLGALDPMIRAELQEDLEEIFRVRGKTVVMVTHDMGEAAHFADEVVLLRAGRVVQRGAVRALLESPAEAFVSDFVRAQRSPLEALR